MRHTTRRIPPMLQWNQKYTTLALVIVLVALAALLGNFTWDFTNFTW